MKLREWDWDKQAFVDVDYPDGLVVDFLNWLRQTKAWHEDVELVHRRVLVLNKDFAAFRQRQAVVASQPSRADINRANLVKARAAKAAKRAAKAA